MGRKSLARTALSAILLLTFAFPSTALATVESETETATDEEAAAALEQGVEGMPAVDGSEDAGADDSTGNGAGDATAQAMSEALGSATMASSDIKLFSYAGDTRYDTAAAIAKAAYPSGVGSATAIVVSGDSGSWADSLAASSLAGMLDCPILYAAQDNVPDGTRNALSQLSVSDVVLVGGTSVVSESVEQDLASLCGSVTRLCGDNRFDTQLAVYNYGAGMGEWSGNVIVASGYSYADALSASSIAFKEKMPIFLANSEGTLSASQMLALTSSDVTSFTIVGGTSAVPAMAEGFFTGVLAKTTGEYDASKVVRLAGELRYDTSWEIASWGVGKGYISWDQAAFASGTSPVDALCGSVLQGKTGAPILLVDEGQLQCADSLGSSSPSGARVFGGTGVVSQTSRNHIAMSLGYKLTQIQGFKVYVDAGHGYNNTGNGGYDPGATGCGYREADLTKELAGKVADRLRADGYDVFLNDDGGPYKYRHAEAVAQDCNVVISVHFNAAGGSGSLSLVHLYNASEYSMYAAQIMQPRLVEGTGLSNLGIRGQEVAILGGRLPAVLLEVAFIDNSHDMSVYQSRKDYVAAQIVAGIEEL